MPRGVVNTFTGDGKHKLIAWQYGNWKAALGRMGEVTDNHRQKHSLACFILFCRQCFRYKLEPSQTPTQSQPSQTAPPNQSQLTMEAVTHPITAHNKSYRPTKWIHRRRCSYNGAGNYCRIGFLMLCWSRNMSTEYAEQCKQNDGQTCHLKVIAFGIEYIKHID